MLVDNEQSLLFKGFGEVDRCFKNERAVVEELNELNCKEISHIYLLTPDEDNMRDISEDVATEWLNWREETFNERPQESDCPEFVLRTWAWTYYTWEAA